MNISQAVECNIIPEEQREKIMNIFSRFPCHICKSFKIEVIPEYGLGTLRFKCKRCGADRGNIWIEEHYMKG